MASPPVPTPVCTLQPMDLWKSTEFTHLLHQRLLCGWDTTSSILESWRASIDTHTLAMFWIIPTSQSHLSPPANFAGHIGMNSKAEAADPTIGRLQGTVQHVSNLFILPEHRQVGLGRAAVQVLEAWAIVEPYGSPACTAMTLNTISRRYTEDESAEWGGFYRALCAQVGATVAEKGRSNEDWYGRMGYRKVGEEPLYPVTWEGQEVLLVAAHLRKDLG